MSKKSESIPEALRPAYDPIIRVIDDVCAKHLNDEYKTLAHKLAAALARKRPSPLTRGKPEVWACGILYALGSVNFLWTNRKRRTCARMNCVKRAASVPRAAAPKQNKSATCSTSFKCIPIGHCRAWWTRIH